MNKIINCNLFDVSKNSLLFDLFNDTVYPWEILPKLKTYVNNLFLHPPKNFSLLKDGVLVGENVEISFSSTIIPPAILGANTIIRPGAFLRGNVVVGENCVIGNSTELKHCILLNNVQVPHFNYVGDSILGNNSHLGAGVICSNLKNNKSNVVVKADKNYDTHLRKVGCFLGDNVDVGCNSVINPGTIIGKNTKVYPLTFLRGYIEEDSLIKQNGKTTKLNNFNNT